MSMSQLVHPPVINPLPRGRKPDNWQHMTAGITTRQRAAAYCARNNIEIAWYDAALKRLYW